MPPVVLPAAIRSCVVPLYIRSVMIIGGVTAGVAWLIVKSAVLNV